MVSKDIRNGTGGLTERPARRPESRQRRAYLALVAITRDPGRRLILAFAISLAVHEIVAMLWPLRAEPPRPKQEVAQTITIIRHTPPPTPRPTVQPTHAPPPVTPPPHPTFAPQVVVHDPAPPAILPVRHHAGGLARRILLHATPKSIAWIPVAIATNAGAGVANGGAGTGAGPGTGDSGLGGSAAGIAGSGSGNGGDSATAPCGSVDFIPVRTQTAADGSQVVAVAMEVTLRDGRKSRDDLGWPWRYPSVAANPFNASNADEPVPMQMPPSDYDVSQLNSEVAYAIHHTSPEGILAFEACPS